MSENGVYPQWNSHVVGIMISKTIGFFGVHNIFRETHIFIYKIRNLSAWRFIPVTGASGGSG